MPYNAYFCSFYTAPQRFIWYPTNGTVPLYHEPYDTIFTDTELRNRLIEHIGANYTTVTQMVTLLRQPPDAIPSDPRTSAVQFIQTHGCTNRQMPDMYPNVTTTGILEELEDMYCRPYHFWASLFPYFFPNIYMAETCSNDVIAG